MEYHFTIHGTLPGLNDYLKAERSFSRKHSCGNDMKQKYQNYIAGEIRNALKRLRIEKKVLLHYLYYEPTKRRDLDNIAATAHKFTQDALVKCGVLENDGWNNICGFTDKFFIDKENPRIEIFIEEIE